MADYQKAIGPVKDNEGGWCKVPGDKGGETYRGISRVDHPSWAGWQIIDAKKPLKYNQVIADPQLEALEDEFYRVNYWTPIHGDEIISKAFAGYFIDWYVNSQNKALEKLHEVLGITPLNGVFGPITLAKVNAAGDGLLETIHLRRLKYYYDHVAAVPTDKKFLAGWVNRSNEMYELLKSEI